MAQIGVLERWGMVRSATVEQGNVASEFRFGIEEEFFVVNEESQLLESKTHELFLATAKKLSDGAVSRELLQSQVEATTPICSDPAEARDHLRRLRSALAEAGRQTGLSVIAAGTHPTANWREQHQTQKKRYDNVVTELQILALRNLVCGMHVHVEMPAGHARRRHAPRHPLPADPARPVLLLALLARHAHGLRKLPAHLLR